MIGLRLISFFRKRRQQKYEFRNSADSISITYLKPEYTDHQVILRMNDTHSSQSVLGNYAAVTNNPKFYCLNMTNLYLTHALQSALFGQELCSSWPLKGPQGILKNPQITSNCDISISEPEGIWQSQKSGEDSHIKSYQLKCGSQKYNIGITLTLNRKKKSQIQPLT